MAVTEATICQTGQDQRKVVHESRPDREQRGKGGGGGTGRVYSQGPSATRFSQGIGQKNMLTKHNLWPIKNGGELANWTIRVPQS